MAGSVPFTGGCACGAIRYECSAEPLLSLNCHCRDCQRASGSAYASILIVPTSTFRLVQGEPAYYSVTADSGNMTKRGFCSTCGSPVLIHEGGHPENVILQAGSLDDPRWHHPIADMYTARAHPWDAMNPGLHKFEGEPSEKNIQELLTARS